jgi:tetratricopeptide (TPR) repeat protein
MTRSPARMLLVLIALTLAIGQPLQAQMDPHVVPRRPVLPMDGDSNSAQDYFWFGMSKLVKEPERAAAAFYWASRIDPSWADPVYSRHVALLLAQPYRLIDAYMTKRREDLHSDRLDAIDSLYYQAIVINPWMNRRIERLLFLTWLQTDLDGSRIPAYLRQENPLLGAWLSYAEGQYDSATAQYATAIAKHPDDHIVRFWRALPFMALGRTDSAIAAVQGALTAFRTSAAESLDFRYVGHPFMEYSLGLLYEVEHQPDSARAAYERSLLDDLTFYPSHRKLANMRLMAGDTTGALAEFEQAATLAPNDVMTLYEYGMLSIAAGQTGPGVDLLKRASAAEPFFVPPHFTLARLYDQGGFVEEAAEEYRTFLRLAPKTMARQVAAVRARLTALGAASSAP